MSTALQTPDATGTEHLARTGRLATLWRDVLAELETDPSISRASFASWIRGAQLLDVNGDEVVVTAQHSFALDKLDRSFRAAIEAAVRRRLGNPAVRVRFALARSAAPSRAHETASRPLPFRTAGKDDASPAAPSSPLNPQWTFESFLLARANHFAHAAAYAVADNPSFAYNPLVLYGPPGAGKSHLLHAIGQRVLSSRPGARVTYVTAHALVTELRAALADANALATLRARHVRADLFLLDDLQELPTVELPSGATVQQEVTRLLSALLASDRQVVAAADAPPRALAHLNETLRARVQHGLIAEVGPRDASAAPPAASTAAPVLAAAARMPTLPSPRVPGPATGLRGRDLGEGPGVRGVRAPASPPTPHLRRPSPDDLLGAVASYYGVLPDVLRAKRRDKEAVTPRQVAMYLLREETDLSLSDVGARLGGRDHSTVLHGCEKIATLLQSDSRLRDDLAAIRQRLHHAYPA